MSVKASGSRGKILLPIDLDNDLDGLEVTELPFEFGWRMYERAQRELEVSDPYLVIALAQAWAETQPAILL